MAKRPRKPATRKPDPAYVSTSVLFSETQRALTGGRTRDFETLARAVSGTAFSAANMNATACAGQTIKLYKPKGKSLARSRAVTSKARLGWLRSGVGAKAAAMASVSDDVEEVIDHPVLNLMYRPDPFMTGTAWMWLAYFYTEAAGRSFMYAGERTRFGPTSLYLLPPQYTTVNGSKTQFIASYTYGVEGVEAVIFQPEDVIYHRDRVHPFRPLLSISWLQTVQAHTDLEAAALASEIARWNNGGIPGMAIVYKDPTGKVTPQQVEQAKEAFNREYRGINKSGATLFTLNADVVQYGAKPHEMQYVEGQRRMEEMVYRAAGIPEPVWKMADSNRASAVSADPQWMGNTILPKLNAMSETLTEFLLPMFEGTDGWWFAYDNPVREDQQFALQRATSLAANGIITGNEARAMQMLDAGGDELDVLRWNGTPLSEADDAGTEVTRVGDGGNAGGVGAKDDTAPGDKPTGDVPAEDEAKHRKPFHAVGKAIQTSSQEVVARAFEDALTRWYQGALANAVAADGTVTLAHAHGELSRLVDTYVRQLFIAGTVDAYRAVGSGSMFNLARPEAAKYLAERGGELIVSVEQTLARTIGNKLADLNASGVSIAEQQAAVSNMGIADWSSERIVRTEMSYAYNEGARQAWQNEGVDAKDFDIAGGPCPVCEAVFEKHGGKPHPIDDPYYRAGDTVVGTDGKTYTFKVDAQGPPWHPNCRCVLLPARSGKDSP